MDEFDIACWYICKLQDIREELRRLEEWSQKYNVVKENTDGRREKTNDTHASPTGKSSILHPRSWKSISKTWRVDMNSEIPDFGDPGFDSLMDGFGFGGKQWKPHPRSRKILSRALEHINSVDYAVSVRWVFYRLLQDGVYSAKKDYDNFTSLTSRARHAFHGDWHPLILADETREMIISEHDGDEPGPDIEYLIELGVQESKDERESLFDEYQNYAYSCSYHVDPNYLQENIIIIMFEARAMTGQFKKYVPYGISLCPFGGQPSIPYKYTIAQYIDRLSSSYNKPVVVLYFGDLDEAGITIFDTGQSHITGWCSSSPTFIRCGLTEAQVEFYGIP